MKLLKPKPKRTQVYFYPDEQEAVAISARKRGVSKAAVIREAVRTALNVRPKQRLSAEEFFKRLSRGTRTMNIPRDLSERHDEYIYGGR